MVQNLESNCTELAGHKYVVFASANGNPIVCRLHLVQCKGPIHNYPSIGFGYQILSAGTNTVTNPDSPPTRPSATAAKEWYQVMCGGQRYDVVIACGQ